MRRPQTSRRDVVRFSPHLRPLMELTEAHQSFTRPSAEIVFMKSLPKFAWLAAIAALLVSPDAMAQSRAQYESMVATHARANHVPEALVHRVIVRESKYQPEPGRARRHHRADADQARRPRAASATPATPRACAIPTPISPRASNISPAPIAPPTAITAAPCVIMRAAITTLQSASGRSGPWWPRRCLRVADRRKSSRGPLKAAKTPAEANAMQVPANSRYGRASAGRKATGVEPGGSSLTPRPIGLH